MVENIQLIPGRTLECSRGETRGCSQLLDGNMWMSIDVRREGLYTPETNPLARLEGGILECPSQQCIWLRDNTSYLQFVRSVENPYSRGAPHGAALH